MSYEYLPGVQVVTVDGGLAQKRAPRAKSTVILGTAGKGRAEEAYQVTDLAVAAQEFGFEGSLIRAMAEVAQGGCDNIYLFRIGTSPAVLSGVGMAKDEDDKVVAEGVNITFSQRTADAGDRYRIFYNGTVLEVFLDGNLVYSNDTLNPVDTGDLSIEGVLDEDNAGMLLKGTGTGSHFEQSLTVAAVGSAPDTEHPAPIFTAADLGLSMNPCELYEAYMRAFELLEIFPIQQVYCPDAKFDAPNVAFLRTDDPKTAIHDPSKGAALGWLKTFPSSDGALRFHWAHLSKDSAGTTTTAPTFNDAKARLAAGYHEVHFQYAIARFAAKQSMNQGGCKAFIGFNGPVNYKPTGLREWIGYLPTYDGSTGAVLSAGKGLCGQALLAGTVSSKLNPLCHGVNTSAFRAPGMFQTVSAISPNEFGEYDEAPVTDKNGYNVDIGAYLHAAGDWGYIRNMYAPLYKGNIAGVVAGYAAAKDDKDAITNKALPGVSQVYRVTMAQLNALTKAKVNMLRFKGDGVAPALLHDYTCATDVSDYIFLLRLDIKFLVCAVLFQEADKFIGESSTDGLQLTAMRTALDRRLLDLQQRKYIGGFDYTITTTDADRRIGRAFIDITFNPPDEAVQIRASISVGRN